MNRDYNFRVDNNIKIILEIIIHETIFHDMKQICKVDTESELQMDLDRQSCLAV